MSALRFLKSFSRWAHSSSESSLMNTDLKIWLPWTPYWCSNHFLPNLSGMISSSWCVIGSFFSRLGNTSVLKMAVINLWWLCLISLISLSNEATSLCESWHKNLMWALINVLWVGSFNSDKLYKSKTEFLIFHKSSAFNIAFNSRLESSFFLFSLISCRIFTYTSNLI